MLDCFNIRIILGFYGLQLISCLLVQYDLEIVNDNFFSPCANYPDNTYDKFFDISAVDVIRHDDDAVSYTGPLKLVYDFKKNIRKLVIEPFKRERGEWQKTTYSIRRKDYCQAIFAPSEFWSQYFVDVPLDERKCPPAIGRIVHLAVNSSKPLELPARNMEGEYNVHIEIGEPGEDEFLCAEVFLNIYRH